MLPADNPEAERLYALALKILLIFVLLLAAVSICIKVLGVVWSAQTTDWLGWVAPGVLMFGLVGIHESWLSRQQMFYVIGGSMIVGTVGTGASRILMGVLAGSSMLGLIFGQFIGLLLRLSFQMWRGGRRVLAASFRTPFRTLRDDANSYSDFPKLNAPAALISSGAKNMPVLLLGFLYGPEPAGFYAMAMRLAQSPLRLLTVSIRRVIYQRLAEVTSAGRSLFRPFWKLSFGLFAIGVIPMLLIMFFGPAVLDYLLGPNWPAAGQYLQVVAPWLFTVLLSVPVGPALNVSRRQDIWLRIQVLSFLIRVVVFVAAYLYGFEPLQAVTLFVTVVVVINVGYICYVGAFLNNSLVKGAEQ